MQVSIRPIDPRPIYLQIMDEIRRALVLGTLKPGDPLPSIRQLASELRVNPNTVAQAYRELEREGTVYVQRGQGTFVSPDVQPGREERRALAHDVTPIRASPSIEVEFVRLLAPPSHPPSDGAGPDDVQPCALFSGVEHDAVNVLATERGEEDAVAEQRYAR